MENKMLLASILAATAVILIVCTPANGHIICEEALVHVMPCRPYLCSSGQPKPHALCCEGLRKVASLATTPLVRKELCQCFKKVAAGISIDHARLKQLPGLCGIGQLPVPLDPSTDCSKATARGLL